MTMCKWLAAIVCAACLLSLAACGPTTTEPADSSFPEPTTRTTEPTTTAPTQPPLDLNTLTGVNNVTPGTSVRPVCIMIGNNDRSRPQVGLDKADLFVEAETEGGITRIMAVFAGVSRLPDKLGPVRSARTPFVLLAESLGAVYCHAGGSPKGLAAIKSSDVGDVNALYGSSDSAFWRDATLRKTKGLEYSMMTGGVKLTGLIKKLKYSTEAKKVAPFTFGTAAAGSGLGNKVQVRMSPMQTISFLYDAGSGLYTKRNGGLTNGETHKMMDGSAITATNVLIIYDQKYNESSATISFKLQSGKGLLVTGGNSRPIRWTRTRDSLRFTDDNGNTLNMKAGKTYLCLTDSGNASKTIVG